MKFKVDRKIFSDECISKVVYWFSNEYAIKRNLGDDNIESIEFLPLKGICVQKNLEYVFFQKLNDFKLRQIIEKETHDIRIILYAKAFERFVD